MMQLPELPSVLLPLIDTLSRHGIRPVIVGGYVRDALLGQQSKDFDIECFGAASLEHLAQLLAPFGKINSVGRSFGVLKLEINGFALDIALPRTETKTGKGHTGFTVESFDTFDFKTAARRRDFTVNAIGYDPVEGTLIDPFGGRQDLAHQTLRCIDPETFVEDPLRLLRAVQFAARFSLNPDEQLLTLARKMVAQGVLAELPKERIYEEFKKLLLKAPKPSSGLRLMEALHITPFFPALNALKQVPIDPSNHKERSVWEHSLMALDVMAKLYCDVDADPMALLLGTLCHDMGKPLTTRLLDGHIKAPAHAEAGVNVVSSFLSQLTDDKRLTATVLNYVRYHGEPKRLFTQNATDADVMRLARHVRIDAICAVATADHLGRTPHAERSEAAEWLRESAQRLGVLRAPLPALIDGNDLIASGLSPSPTFKTILDAAYDAQLEGAFADKTGARRWLESYLPDLGKS